jgi:hypothetical protein
MLVFGGQPPGGLGNMGFAGVLVAPDTGRVFGVISVPDACGRRRTRPTHRIDGN